MFLFVFLFLYLLYIYKCNFFKILTHIEARNHNNVPKGYYISVVRVVIINDKNESLVQKRSRLKRVNPSKWGICSGKVDLGETPLDACIREILEEIGAFWIKKI